MGQDENIFDGGQLIGMEDKILEIIKEKVKDSSIEIKGNSTLNCISNQLPIFNSFCKINPFK